MEKFYEPSAFEILASNTNAADIFTLILWVAFCFAQTFYSKNKTLDNIHYKSQLPEYWLQQGSSPYSKVRWATLIFSLIFSLIGQWYFLFYLFLYVIAYPLAVDAGKRKAYSVFIEVARSILNSGEKLPESERNELIEQTNISFSEFKSKEKLFINHVS